MFDLDIGFYTKFYYQGQVLGSRVLHSGQIMGNSMFMCLLARIHACIGSLKFYNSNQGLRRA